VAALYGLHRPSSSRWKNLRHGGGNGPVVAAMNPYRVGGSFGALTQGSFVPRNPGLGDAILSGLVVLWMRKPRVARASQPWAE